MMLNDFNHKAVLITGGTKGIGLATGLAFGRQGAHVYLTHKWGSVDEDTVRQKFTEAKAKEPSIICADVANDEDTGELLNQLGQDHASIEVFVSNVAFSQKVSNLDDYRQRSFLTSLGYSAWPMVGYLQQIKKMTGSYPRYVIGMSSDGAQTYYPDYSVVAASKTVMDVFCRYLSTELFDEDIRINILRSRPVSTDSLTATLGPEFESFVRKYHGDRFLIDAEEVANAALALCSGMMDAVSGQVITLDRGMAFCDNIMLLYEQRESLGL